MANYIVSDPTGKKHIIQGPAGASPDQVIQQAQKIIPKSPQQPTAGIPGAGGQPVMQNPQQQPQQPPQQQPMQQQQPQPQQMGQQPFNPPQISPELQAAFFKMYPDALKQAIGNKLGGQDPYKQAQIAYLQARTNKLNNPQQMDQGTQAYLANDGSVSLTPTQGARPVNLKPGQIASIMAGQKGRADKSGTLGSYVDFRNREMAVNQANKSNLNPSQVRILQNNNMRADRAISLASNPNVTWQEFNQVLTDVAGIMQGGVPHVDQIKAQTYPTWQEQYARLRTYATGHPTENVPPEIRQRVLGVVQGLKAIDNKYLKAGADINNQILGTLPGGNKYQNIVNNAVGQITQGGVPQQQQSNGGWSIQKVQ